MGSMRGGNFFRFIMCGILILWQIISASDGYAAPHTFERRVWGKAEGAPEAAYSVAQDADGTLWFSTVTGLYRFDGARFTQVDSVYGYALPSNNVLGLKATPNGLAVSYQYGGVSVFTRDAARHYSRADGLPRGRANLAVDNKGTLYAATYLTGISVLDAKSGKWALISDPILQNISIEWLDFDDEGTMWIATEGILYARGLRETSFRKISEIVKGSYPSIINGKLMAVTGAGQVTGFSLRVPLFVFRIARDAGLMDSPFQGPDGTWWAWLKSGTTFLNANDGMLRAAQSFDGGDKWGKMVMRTFMDRENNLWITTPEGVERYRRHRLFGLSLPSAGLDLYIGRGLSNDLLVSSREEMPLHRLNKGRLEALRDLRGFSSVYRQDAENVWLGGSAGLAHLTADGISRWPFPKSSQGKIYVQGIVADRNGRILVSIVRDGLYRFENGNWIKLVLQGASDDDVPICMYRGASGRTYLGYTHGRLAELSATGISMVTTELSETVGNILSMVEHDGKLLVGGERGVVWLHGTVAQSLHPKGTNAFLGVSGMVFAKDKALWMHGSAGLFRVPADELAHALSGVSPTVNWEVFNFEDGLRGRVSQMRPLPSLSLGNDGNIYYATSSQIGWIDPTAIPRNPRAPTVLVMAVKTGQGNAPVKAGMVLSAGTTSLEIQFAATALSIPERVRFRYRLVGVDKEWQESGMERSARYTNLGPGAYRFQVTAANEDGVWNSTGAKLEFHVAPMLWQTHWFRAIAIAALLSMMWLLYRWRIATAARRAAEKTATRLEERERIARNLHDNLLQGVQALIMNCHAILMRMPTGTSEERKLSEALDRADQMIKETRDEVMDLRGESAYLPLGERLQQSITAMETLASKTVDLKLSGLVDRLDCRVATELFYILQEAVRNSIRHADAAQIQVIIDVTEAGVQGAVIDDGRGMQSDMIEKGKAGHWGLAGMRERVYRLGGSLTIDSKVGGGTSVKVMVPSPIAFGTNGKQAF